VFLRILTGGGKKYNVKKGSGSVRLKSRKEGPQGIKGTGVPGKRRVYDEFFT